MPDHSTSWIQGLLTSPQPEWLETNGLGGWSSSTVSGKHTRRYHGLLTAATVVPTERMVLVSHLDERLICEGETYELSTHRYKDVIYPEGYKLLNHFNKDFFPEFTYQAKNILLKKTIAMIHGQNTVVIVFELSEASPACQLELMPLLAMRGYHSLMHENEYISTDYSFLNAVFATRPYHDRPSVFIKIPGSNYHHSPDWYRNFNYEVEKYRGLDFEEDLYKPGTFSVDIGPGEKIQIIISDDHPGNSDAFVLMQGEYERRKCLLKNVENELAKKLTLAADQFIVKRGENLKTIIAGYHWFTDWGRDTMISLPGICLATGRFDDAKKILEAFAEAVQMGMLPNRFTDAGDTPEFNTVDATLWFFIAVQKYYLATEDKNFILEKILPVLKDIIDWHFRGTRYNIHVDDDGLLYSGETGQQLTWMDARVGDYVVTPRMGKPVEIQALWYNALLIFAEFLKMNEQYDDAGIVMLSAEKTKKSFSEKFWYAEGNYLFDYIDQKGVPSAECRPNQIFALSLPFVLIEGEKAEAVLKTIEERLYVPPGLRTLPENDPKYIPVYGGDQWHRDTSYHQGTAWSWLLGPYIDAIMRVYNSKEKGRQVIGNFSYHLNEACIGSVSEIFDAAPPHHPRGCVAQAWGVAEILRVITEYQLHV